MGRLIYVHRRRSGGDEGRPQACDAGVSATIHKDIGLEEREHIIKSQCEDRTHNLEISVDDAKEVHTI